MPKRRSDVTVDDSVSAIPFLRGAELIEEPPGVGYPFELAAVRGLDHIAFAAVTTT